MEDGFERYDFTYDRVGADQMFAKLAFRFGVNKLLNVVSRDFVKWLGERQFASKVL